MNAALQKLRDSVTAPSSLSLVSTVNVDALAGAPAPLHGTVSWELPPSYRAFLAEAGRFELSWFSPALDKRVSIELFDAEGIADASEIVYMPKGVDLGNGEVTTNHLVPFAGERGGEWAFCFDASVGGPEYAVYYHHQDSPRAKSVASGEWDPVSNPTADFANFGAWLDWLARAVGAAIDPEVLGQPHAKMPRPVA